MRLDIVDPGIGVQGDEGNHSPLVKEPVDGIVIHGAICKKVFEGDGRKELSDFVQGKNGQNAVMPWGLSDSEVYGEVIGTIGGNGVKESVTIEILLMVAVPAPAGIGVRITARTLTVVDSVTLAITDFDPMMTCAGNKAGTIHGK